MLECEQPGGRIRRTAAASPVVWPLRVERAKFPAGLAPEPRSGIQTYFFLRGNQRFASTRIGATRKIAAAIKSTNTHHFPNMMTKERSRNMATIRKEYAKTEIHLSRYQRLNSSPLSNVANKRFPVLPAGSLSAVRSGSGANQCRAGSCT